MEGSPGTDPADLGVLEAAALLATGGLSSVELTEACLRRIDERNGGPPSAEGAPGAINAWVRLYPERARAGARAADRRRHEEGPGTPLLCGIPLAVKDIYGVAGLPLTASSRVLAGNVSTDDAAALAPLLAQGMVVLGHTHTHEFAAGGTTDQVGNPWDPTRVAGGSSGGSAAALAARMVPAAVGTDTCGSLRIPSSFCGTSAVKPTHGRLPIEGIIPLAASMDHPGPMARTVADCAALLSAMATAVAVTPLMPPASPLGSLPTEASSGSRPLAGLVLAVTDHALGAGWEDRVGAGFDEARRAAERLGARVVELPAPWVFGDGDLQTVLLTEMWDYHRRHEALLESYRPAVAETVEAARTFTDAQAYLAAQRRRAEGTAAWEAWFGANGVDLVIEPTLPLLPLPRGPGYERGHNGGAGDPLIVLTAPWDMTGMPVACLPVTWDVGISLAAPRGEERRLVQAAIDLQEHALGVPAYAPPAGSSPRR
ncbi:MAG: amidase [Acidimicrobiales bacterium]